MFVDNSWSRREFLRVAGTGSVALSSAAAAANRGDAPSTPNLNDGNRTPWFLRDDLPWKGKLSKPEYEGKLRFEFDAKVPLRDGVHLSANIWRPDAPGNFPVVLMYTPYDSTSK